MPNIHPFLVHFPVALMTLSLICEAACIFRMSEELTRVGWWTQLAGTAGIAAAVISGLLAEKDVRMPAGAQELFAVHQQLAFAATAILAALLLWRIAMRSRIPGERRVLFVLLLFGGVVVMLLGAWYGGKMVYGLGVGVARGSG